MGPYFDAVANWFVCPVTLLRPGFVRDGLELRASDIGKSYRAGGWDRTPLCIGHPTTYHDHYGKLVGNRHWLRDHGIGELRRPWFRDGVLGAHAYFDLERVFNQSPELYRRLLAGERIAVSAGCHQKRRMALNGRHRVATKLSPDHVAVVLRGQGAIPGAMLLPGRYAD